MLIPFAHAQAAGTAAAPADASGGMTMFIIQILLIGVVFYFLIIRPQSKRAKLLRESIAGIKKNDQVITAGGILGKVTRVNDPYVEVEIAPNMKVQVVRSTIVEVVSPTTAKPAND